MAEYPKNNENRTFSTVLKGLGVAALLLLPFACGFVEFLDSTGRIIRREWHDHDNLKKGIKGHYVQDEHFNLIPYDSEKHGKPVDTVAEGEIITNYPTAEGTVNIHEHPNEEHPVVPYGPYDIRNIKIQDLT